MMSKSSFLCGRAFSLASVVRTSETGDEKAASSFAEPLSSLIFCDEVNEIIYCDNKAHVYRWLDADTDFWLPHSLVFDVQTQTSEAT